MNTNKEIPYQFNKIFNTFEEYRNWDIQKSKEELLKAFPKEKKE